MQKMSGQPTYCNVTIIRRPSVRQFFANDFITAIVCVAGIVVAGIDGVYLANLLFWFSVTIVVCLIYRFYYLRSMRYTVTADQLISEYGVFHRSRDFMELYRIIDFKEESSLMQQMLGLKTVRIFSGDRSTPRLDIAGIDSGDNLVPVIRERVTINKRRHGIYEITNR